MQLLGEFFIENDIESLPVVSLAYSGKWKIKGVEKQYNYAVLDFQGIFDAAAIGQLLGGKDKRSYKDIINGKYGTVQNTEVVPLVNEDAVYEYTNAIFRWKTLENGLSIPWCIENNSETPILNLHVHSKELYRFKSNAYNKGI